MKKKTTSARRRTHDGSKNYEISGIVIFCFGIFAFISLFGGGTGIMGKWVSDGIHFLFGLAAPAAALFLVLFGARYALASRGIFMSRRNVLLAVLCVLFLCLVHHYYVPKGREMEISEILSYGGIIGGSLTSFFHLALGEIGTTILLLGFMVVDGPCPGERKRWAPKPRKSARKPGRDWAAWPRKSGIKRQLWMLPVLLHGWRN